MRHLREKWWQITSRKDCYPMNQLAQYKRTVRRKILMRMREMNDDWKNRSDNKWQTGLLRIEKAKRLEKWQKNESKGVLKHGAHKNFWMKAVGKVNINNWCRGRRQMLCSVLSSSANSDWLRQRQDKVLSTQQRWQGPIEGVSFLHQHILAIEKEVTHYHLLGKKGKRNKQEDTCHWHMISVCWEANIIQVFETVRQYPAVARVLHLLGSTRCLAYGRQY